MSKLIASLFYRDPYPCGCKRCINPSKKHPSIKKMSRRLIRSRLKETARIEIKLDKEK